LGPEVQLVADRLTYYGHIAGGPPRRDRRDPRRERRTAGDHEAREATRALLELRHEVFREVQVPAGVEPEVQDERPWAQTVESGEQPLAECGHGLVRHLRRTVVLDIEDVVVQ